eukprot:XP_012820885.1 PREDICTED: tumor necrosis factor receptor superfamily member 11A [Xenopus tropicalis]
MGTSPSYVGMGSVGLFLLNCVILCACSQLLQQLQCDPEKQYESNGRCCSKCQPGFYMTSKCTASKNTTCNPCGPNEYMSSWNDDYKCISHHICDSGKALKVAFRGNSTSPRKCVCEKGYHFSQDYEFCNENTKCPPGYGVVYTVQRNTDTICETCTVGYFSNSSSSDEPCKPWTNCSKLGHPELNPGTDHSDVVCDHLLNNNWQRAVILIVLFTVITIVIFTAIYFLCCTKCLKDLKENLEQWVSDLCHRFQEAEKKSSCNVCTRTNNFGQGQISTTYVAVAVSNEMGCVEAHEVHKPQSGTPGTNCVREYEVKQRRSGPIESEYLERKTVGVVETEQLIDGSAHVSDTTESLVGNETFSYFSSDPDQNSCHLHHLHIQQDACEQSARELTGKQTVNSNYGNCSMREPLSSRNGHCPQFSPLQFSGSPGMNFFEETASQSSGSSGGNTPMSETPPLSGQVTGNNNTTVISNGSVMNIKAEVLLLVLNPSSQDVPTTPDSTDGNMGSPVQEENQCRCDSFVANTENHAGKYTQYSDDLSNVSQNPEGWTCSTDFIQGILSPPPVQEEGKPEYSLCGSGIL